MRILITGGAGFIGSHLADELLEAGHSLRALDNLSPQVHGEAGKRPGYLNDDVELVEGDVRDPAAVARALDGIEAVYHFAAAVGVGQSMYEVAQYTSVNNLGTAVLLEALIKRPVSRLIVASSMSIYGEGLYQDPDGNISSGLERNVEQLHRHEWEVRNNRQESLAPLPTPESKTPTLASVYALSKYDQERLCLMIGRAYAISTVALRFFNVYGPRQALSNPYTGVLAIFASRYLNDRPPVIFEDGRQRRDFVSVHDVARACRLALEVPDANGRSINIGSGNSYSILEIAQRMAKVMGKEQIEPEISGRYRVGDIRHCFADIRLARRLLGYEPRVSLEQFESPAQIWITDTGYSTWRHDERRQLTAFVDAIDAPVDRVYWFGAHDLDPRLSTTDGFHADEREYHFGLRRADGAEKLLYRIWADGGIEGVRDAYWLGKSAYVGGKDRPVLITGGCGFIGTNLAHRVLSSGRSVLLFDNLSRPGVERNLAWLHRTHKDLMRIEAADVQDPHLLRSAVARASQVFHFAAQVAVTTSLTNAVQDFEVNARGTLNLLEALRAQDDPPPLVFTSTNKVYGGLPDVKLQLNGQRYEPQDAGIRENGIGEWRPLDFHSPYGCSKGAADQYVVDYARTFGLPAVVFRMSCIYGPHQFGNEDQGWVAHFLIRALKGDPITLYGDGRQVRDILFIEDLVDAFLLAQAEMPRVSGNAFNIGGGPHNTISLIELLDLMEELHGIRPEIRTGAWRPGDQRYYVSDFSKMKNATGWSPKVDVREGVRRLYDWLRDNTSRPRTHRAGARAGRDAWTSDAKTRAGEERRGTDRKVAM